MNYIAHQTQQLQMQKGTHGLQYTLYISPDNHFKGKIAKTVLSYIFFWFCGSESWSLSFDCLLTSCDCKYIASPHGVMGWSAVCCLDVNRSCSKEPSRFFRVTTPLKIRNKGMPVCNEPLVIQSKGRTNGEYSNNTRSVIFHSRSAKTNAYYRSIAHKVIGVGKKHLHTPQQVTEKNWIHPSSSLRGKSKTEARW